MTPVPRVFGRLAAALVAGLALVAAAAAPALAHGGEVPPPPDAATLILGWSLHPQVLLPLVLAAAAYLWAVRRVDRAHPDNQVPRDRPVFWLIGLACLAIALLSGIERYDTELFSVHMVQHLLIVFGAAPALVLAAPITLLLRVASPGVRNGWILPVLRSWPVKLISHPLVAWLLFTAVMWGSHVSPLFDAALEDPIVHDLEHGLYLATSMLFWWPVVGRDPSPWRLPYPARIGYLFLQMPLNSLLGVAILFADRVLYPHYLTTGRLWPPTPLEDQQLAGALMWGLGDLGFLVAILLVIAAWMRAEEAATRRREAVEDARAARLAVAAGSGAAGAVAAGSGAAGAGAAGSGAAGSGAAGSSTAGSSTAGSSTAGSGAAGSGAAAAAAAGGVAGGAGGGAAGGAGPLDPARPAPAEAQAEGIGAAR